MTENVVNLGDAANDGTMMSVKATLKMAMSDIGERGAMKAAKKCILIALDDTTGKYNVSWYQAGMKMSECVSLLEVAKVKMLNEMEMFEDRR